MSKKIAYIMSRFPHLPETFILREMIAIEQQGWQVGLYPLIDQSDSTVVHAEAKAWVDRVNGLPFASGRVLKSILRRLFKSPARLVTTVAKALWQNLSSPKFFIRTLVLIPKAIYAADLMEKDRISHIHAHYATHPALVAWIIYRLTGISYSVTVHAHDIFVQQEMLSTKLKDAAFIVSISQFNLNFLETVVGPWVRFKTHIIHCGIEPEKYGEAEINRPALQDGLEIIATGSLQPYKGFQHLIAACKHLRERGIPFQCRIIGEGSERPTLERLITAANLDDKIKLLGAKTQSEVKGLLETANCYVQPSVITPSGKMEGIPVALMEAMASGLPVVASDISGIPELVKDGDTGFLVPAADGVALANSFEKIYTKSNVALEIAKRGTAHVLIDFALTRSARQLSNLFERIEFRRSGGRVYRFQTGEMPEWHGELSK